MYIHTHIHTHVLGLGNGWNVQINQYRVQWNLFIKDTLGPSIYVLITEISSIWRSFYTFQYYTRTQNGILNIEVFLIQRFVIERPHCNQFIIVYFSQGNSKRLNGMMYVNRAGWLCNWGCKLHVVRTYVAYPVDSQ